MCSRAATCGPTSAGMFVLLLPGIWIPLTVTPLSTVWQGTSRQFRQESAGFRPADAARGPAKKAEEYPENVELRGRGGGSRNGQKIKDTRAPLSGFRKFVVPLGGPKKVTNLRVNWLTAQFGSSSGGERSCPWPPLDALFPGN